MCDYVLSRVPHVIGKTTPSKYDRYITLIHSSFQETSGRKRSDIISNIKTWRFELFPFCAFWSQFGCFVKSLHNVQLTGITGGWRPGKDSEAAKVCDEGTFCWILSILTTSKLSNTATFNTPLKKYLFSRTQLIPSVLFICIESNANRVASNFHRKIREVEGQHWGICYFNRLLFSFVRSHSREQTFAFWNTKCTREIFYTSKPKRDRVQ